MSSDGGESALSDGVLVDHLLTIVCLLFAVGAGRSSCRVCELRALLS